MLYRILLCCLLGGFVLPAMAVDTHSTKTPQALEKKLVELERSVAILQVSSASTDDYQIIEQRLNRLQTQLEANTDTADRIDFLSNVVFLLCVILGLCVFFLRRQSRQLANLLSSNEKDNTP